MKVDILKLAKLSKLAMSSEEAIKFEGEMQSIIEMVEKLPEIAGENNLPDPLDSMELRKDVVLPSLKREELLKNAAQTQAGCIVVPKVVE